jgi:hypothetical protein
MVPAIEKPARTIHETASFSKSFEQRLGMTVELKQHDLLLVCRAGAGNAAAYILGIVIPCCFMYLPPRSA